MQDKFAKDRMAKNNCTGNDSWQKKIAFGVILPFLGFKAGQKMKSKN